MSERFHYHPLLLDISPSMEQELTPQQAYEIFSKPQSVTLLDLKTIHKNGTTDFKKNEYVVDGPAHILRLNKKIVYSLTPNSEGDYQGVKREVVFYRHLLKTKKPHILDTERRITYTYDEENYLTREVDMEFGRLGHIYNFQYVTLENGQKVLNTVIGQTVGRQGFMEPGHPIGNSERIDFSEFHPKPLKISDEIFGKE